MVWAVTPWVHGDEAAASGAEAAPEASATVAKTEGAPAAQAVSQKKPAEPALTDAPLEAYRTKLLKLGFATASSYPINPHIKNRSRAQAKVITGCLKLGQAKLAAEFTKDVENWRLGLCYAELAHYCANHDRPEKAKEYLRLAAMIGKAKNMQTMRTHEVIQQVFDVYTMMGEHELAIDLLGGLVRMEPEQVAEMKQRARDGDHFDEETAMLDGMIRSPSFDLQRHAIDRYVKLYEQHYDQKERRELIEERLIAALSKTLLFVRMDGLLRMAECAVARKDSEKAMSFVNEAQKVLDNTRFRLEDQIAWMAHVARVRYLAGDRKRAAADIASTRELFDSKHEEIKNYERAKAIRPIAEALAAMGEAEAARETYRETIRQGAVNPNIRPRTNALTETCVSMAVHGIEPDEAMWDRMHQIFGKLAANN